MHGITLKDMMIVAAFPAVFIMVFITMIAAFRGRKNVFMIICALIAIAMGGYGSVTFFADEGFNPADIMKMFMALGLFGPPLFCGVASLIPIYLNRKIASK